MNEKKLYKSESNKKISGVCAGVAEYFGIDPTIVRIIWFVVTWFYGIGLIIYIALSLILPTESEVNASMSGSQAGSGSDVYVRPAAARDVDFDVKETPAEPEAKPAADSEVVEFNLDEPTE